jgi:Transglutaminase-like superfamily
MAWFSAIRSKTGTALRLPVRDLGVFAEAWVALLWVRIMTRALPFSWWKARVRPSAAGEVSAAPLAPPLRRIMRMARAAERNHPGTITCLQRSLALQTVLHRRGMPSTLRFGVRTGKKGPEAHAWIEVNGVVLNDTPDVAQRFPAFAPAGRLAVTGPVADDLRSSCRLR